MLNGNEHRTVGTVKLGLHQLQEEKHWFIATTEFTVHDCVADG